MASCGCLGLGLFCWALLAVPVGPQLAPPTPGVTLNTLSPPPQSEASMLSLNLGLNFKFHLRGPAAAWGSPVTETQRLPPGLGREPEEEEVASGLRMDPLWELLVGSLGSSPPEWGSAEGSSMPWASSLPLASTSPLSGPQARPTAPSQPQMGSVTWGTALTATAPPFSAPRPHQSELELKFDMAVRAGAAPTLGHRTLPLLPSLRASLAEIAGRLGPFGFFGTTLSPLRNVSGPSLPGATTLPNSASGVSESPGFFGTTLSPSSHPPERKLSRLSLLDPAASLSSATVATESPDPTSGPDDPSPTDLDNASAQPECGPEPCDLGQPPDPDPELQPPAAPPLPLFFLSLGADWAEARARWGLAWEAHVYGVGALFGLVALLALLALALLPWRCPPGAPCLALLDLLLFSAGATRAFPLFYDAYGHRARLPALAWLLLQDLPLPCLASGLGLACLLMARPRPPRCPGGLAALLLLGLGLAAAAALGSAAHRPLLPLRLAARGLHALLAALLSGLLLALSCLRGRRRRAGAPLGGSGFKGATPLRQARSPFAPRESWRRAARTAPVAGTFGLLSGALQGYEVLHALGYGGQPGLEGPWPWWAFQLGLRLGEVGVALPLALLGLYPALCSPRVPPRCWAKLFRLSPGHAAPLLPGSWGPGLPAKEPLGSTLVRGGEAELLQLCALAGPGPDLLLQGGGCRGLEGRAAHPASSHASSPGSDCTVDFRPPSPINLRRSIEEALCSEALLAPGLFQGPAFGEALPGLGLYRSVSVGPQEGSANSGKAEEEAPASPTSPEPPSPGAWPVGSSASSGSLYGLSRDSSSMLLCSSPDRPPRCPLVCVLSPPRPAASSPSLPASGSYQALTPPSRDSPEPARQLRAEEALLQEQFLDACRQIDELSMGSDTVDL
ncbi:proline-rich transmembrane protein 4 [Echinops telfairi]|uniref:Proline-rich transmembrane protein 4 n=1 Tax=Echinops telfairi TaxID=9371 RepID=A0ABM0IU90_ECHTE|nr:proline-rich transmembrane protein 4 [Echinops telfairi]